MLKVNQQQFQDWAHENRTLALAVCRAQAAAEITRARVDNYILPIFHSFKFVFSGELASKLDEREGQKFYGTPLQAPGDLSLCDDPRIPEYYKACDAAHRAHGYTNLPKGHCPALRMESLFIRAQGTLIDTQAEIDEYIKREPHTLLCTNCAQPVIPNGNFGGGDMVYKHRTDAEQTDCGIQDIFDTFVHASEPESQPTLPAHDPDHFNPAKGGNQAADGNW